MRPVNLLPQKHRGTQAATTSQNASYAVLGGLAVVLVGVVVLVLTQNSISQRTADIAGAKQEEQAAKAKTGQLGSFGAFAKVKEARLTAVKSAAAGRLDYERVLRELAKLLPAGVWISSADVSTGSTAGTAATATAGAPAPTLELTGCAPSHDKVAATLVRLRALNGASDVELASSAKASAGASGTSASAGSQAGDATSGAACKGATFSATVSFTTSTTSAPGSAEVKVPKALGGGS